MTLALGADERLVPAREGRFELRERASRFLGIALACGSSSSASETLSRWRREFHDASHVAFAWRIGPPDRLVARSSDAGEPSGSAGKPIALAIESAALSDVLVGVVRWFGGTKLGTGGLARAYRTAAAGALAAAGSRVEADTRIVRVFCPWSRIGDLRRLVRPPEVAIVSETFAEEAAVRLAVFRSRVPALAAALEEARLPYAIERGEDPGPDSRG
ncbi:MAG TPA: YigZ family protein [Thermoanaerobaculia bacterium]|nr:YigZ family protein [Thermoanaerobaculia bacterium]